MRSKYQMHTITEMDIRSGAILARNAYSPEFEDRYAFFDVNDDQPELLQLTVLNL